MRFVSDYFETWNNRNTNTFFSAQINVIEIHFIIEEHLRNYIVCTCIYFLFDKLYISFQIWRFKMFFRITTHANTKVRRFSIKKIFFKIFTGVHRNNLSNKISSQIINTRSEEHTSEL